MSTAKVKNLFRVGDILTAEVVELQPQKAMIISYKGQLFRVINQSQRRFQVGSELRLIVHSTLPFELRVYERSTKQIDRMI